MDVLHRSADVPDRRGILFGVLVGLLLASIVPVPIPSGEGSSGFLLGPTALFHLVGYGVLAAVVRPQIRPRSIAHRSRPIFDRSLSHLGRSRPVLVTVLLVTGYGAAIEVVQWFIPWRSFALTDVLLNAIGAVIGVSLGQIRRRVTDPNA
ncbi:MAG: VanZ family protein [Halobacteriota archaeon]